MGDSPIYSHEYRLKLKCGVSGFVKDRVTGGLARTGRIKAMQAFSALILIIPHT